MVANKHCAWGTCRNDSRYSDRWERNKNGDDVFFVRFPTVKKDPERRKKWIKACHRGDGFHCSKDSYICSTHFIGEKGPTISDPDPISATTSKETLRKIKKKRKAPMDRDISVKKRRNTLSTPENRDPDSSSFSMQTPMYDEAGDGLEDMDAEHEQTAVEALLNLSSSMDTSFQTIETKVNSSGMQTNINLNHLSYLPTQVLTNKEELRKYVFLEKVDDNIYHYTGLEKGVLHFLFDIVREKGDRLSKWRGHKHNKKKESLYREKTDSTSIKKLSTWEQFLLTLIKLRRNPSMRFLGDLFGISEGNASNIFVTWVLFLAKELLILQPFSTLEEMVGLHRPKTYRKHPFLRGIIDCTEFYIQTPSLPSSQRITHSSYKSANTFKLLVSLSPVQHFNFISSLYCGSTSDKEMVVQSGFLDALQPGDEIMADKGFNIQDLLALKEVRLIAPPIMAKGTVSARASTSTRRVATKRVHVERIIRRIKCFRILHGVIPLTMKPYVDSVIKVCGSLVNLQQKIIAE